MGSRWEKVGRAFGNEIGTTYQAAAASEQYRQWSNWFIDHALHKGMKDVNEEVENIYSMVKI